MDNRNLSPRELSVLRRKIVEAVVVQKNSQKSVAEMYGFTEATVSHYVRAYKEKGSESFEPKKRGRPLQSCTKLCPEDEEQVRHVIETQTPDQVGLECVLWTRKAVRQHIEHTYGVVYSVRGMGDVLKRWGFTPQKPMKVAIQQNPNLVHHWLHVEYPAIYKRACQENAEIYFGDEMGLSSTDQRGRTYGKRGQTPVIRKTGSRFRSNMICAITNQGSMRWMVFQDSFTVDVFLTFLRRLIYKAHKKIFLIVDNLKVHHAKKVQEWLKKHQARIEIFYLPPYCPEMNPQELVNQEIKGHASNFRLMTCLNDLTINLRLYLTRIQFNPCKIMNYFKKESVAYAK